MTWSIEQSRARVVPFAGGWGAALDAENLTDRRDPVTESEFGDAQFYRMPGRRLVGTLSYGL